MDDTISRQEAIDALMEIIDRPNHAEFLYTDEICKTLNELSSTQPEQTRIFVELVVEYPDPELCTYKEYKGKPYYSIKYIENGARYVGYGTYKPEVLSQYLREYFMPSAQPEIVLCKDCKYYKLSSLNTGHMACHYVIGSTVVRKPDDFCSRAERKIDD